MQEGMDPDDVIRDGGAAAFGELVEGALPILEWELSRVMQRADGKGERETMEAVRDAVSILAGVPAGVEREYYVTWLARRAASGSPDRLRNMESAVREELARRARRAPQPAGESRPPAGHAAAPDGQTSGKPAARRLFDSLLAGLLQHGEYAGRVTSELGPEDFPEPEQREVFTAIAGLSERGEVISPQSVLSEVDAGARNLLAQLALEHVPHERIEEFLASAVGRLLEVRLGRQQRRLQERLGEAVSDEDREALRQELAEVARRRSALAGQRIVGNG
jgi:DNA primase